MVREVSRHDTFQNRAWGETKVPQQQQCSPVEKIWASISKLLQLEQKPFTFSFLKKKKKFNSKELHGKDPSLKNNSHHN